jgi:hypothetical protein
MSWQKSDSIHTYFITSVLDKLTATGRFTVIKKFRERHSESKHAMQNIYMKKVTNNKL